MYISVGHQQMMTDAMKPLGISFWQLTAGRPMFTAGGRLFVDVTQDLASPARRAIIVDVMGNRSAYKRRTHDYHRAGRFYQIVYRMISKEQIPGKSNQGSSLADYKTLNEYDPAIVSDLIKRSETSIEELKQNIQTKSGSDLLDFILEDIQQLKKNLI